MSRSRYSERQTCTVIPQEAPELRQLGNETVHRRPSVIARLGTRYAVKTPGVGDSNGLGVPLDLSSSAASKGRGGRSPPEPPFPRCNCGTSSQPTLEPSTPFLLWSSYTHSWTGVDSHTLVVSQHCRRVAIVRPLGRNHTRRGEFQMAY
ncbi:hypothetical protein OUZ56_012433 [Daphnia magna]|uniref:Uncharacterized protein n=1 Tax=Daphnia magna TaxID=35525 RepID=A0ABQ9Z306_9CRUS|nr:hypothetical protein OUZ56_012433 [Daphnia magna]